MPSTPKEETQFFMKRTEGPHPFTVPCMNSYSCQMTTEELALANRTFYTDEMTNRTYCEKCGNRLRYHRKKWSERGEELPETLEDVAKRHET